jgi:hypothetical protein
VLAGQGAAAGNDVVLALQHSISMVVRGVHHTRLDNARRCGWQRLKTSHADHNGGLVV